MTTKTTQNAKDAKQTASQNAPTSDAKPEQKIIKLNKDKFANRKTAKTKRSELESDGISNIHRPKGDWTNKRESDAYYNARKLTFDLTKTEHRTPQENGDLIQNFLDSKLGKGTIATTKYIARNFELQIFRSDKPQNEYIGFDLRKPIDAIKFVDAIRKG